MKKLFLFILFFHCASCIYNCAFSQNPLVKIWDYRFGGTSWDMLASVIQTPDSGILLTGNSKSGIGGDKTQANWDTANYFYDYWVVKTDAAGNKIWDRRFGGIDGEGATCAIVNRIGNYMIGGTSSSGQTGNRSQPSKGNNDYWILEIDPSGNILWDKCYGGTLSDELTQIQQTADGGYILGGQSNSDIGGDKTEDTHGLHDYWIVKIDSVGTKQWDHRYGGNAEDYLYSLQVTGDQGFILAGQSGSGLSGEKSENTLGGYDYWIVKTDSLGNFLWDETIGSNLGDYLQAMSVAGDGGFLLAGIAPDGISVDKTQAGWGLKDFWIVKTDSLGNKSWDKTIGGNNQEDELNALAKTSDGNFLVAGTSYSNISGDKSENNFGVEETWVVKIDTNGNKIWDKTIFTDNIVFHDESGFVMETFDGCYLISNYTWTGIGGDKTQPNRDSTNNSPDYFILKFCEIPNANFSSNEFTCPGTCIDFINLSTSADNYSWNFPGANPDTSTISNPQNICYATPGSYDVQLIASNANGSDTLLLQNYITVYPTPPPQGITQNGDTLFAIAGSSLYQWYFNGNMINGATDYFYVALASGNYNVVATDNNGCEVEAVINNVIAETKLAVGNGQWAIFPNPVEDKFTIHNLKVTSGTAVEISIYNLLGERVLIQESRSKIKEEIIDVSKLERGLYYLQVISGEKIYRTKFLKE